MRVTTVSLTLLTILLLPTPKAHGQKGKDIAEGLLRALIESQLDRSRRRSNDPRDPFRPSNVRPTQVTAEMQRLRPISVNLANETGQLITFMRNDAQRSPAARGRLTEAIRLHANARALQQRTVTLNNHAQLQNDFRSLNSDWSTLAFHLDQCQGISGNTRACIKRINGIDTQYCSLYGFQEQFNSRDLTRAAYSLTTYVSDLTQEAQRMNRRDAEHRKLMRNLGRYVESVNYFTTLATRNSPYQTVAAKFKESHDIWAIIEPSLNSYPSLHYPARRIRETDRAIHELLRLPVGIDRGQLLQIVHAIDEAQEQLARCLTLEHLMYLPDASSVPDLASEFQGNIANLDDLVHRDQPVQDIGEAWVFADEPWQQLAYLLGGIRDAQVAAQLRSIRENMQAIKRVLNVSVTYDRDALVRSATSLEFHADNVVDLIERWQRRPGQHDRQLLTKARSLSDGFHRLEVALAAGRGGLHHRRECDQQIALWQDIRATLKTCESAEREELDFIAARMTPEMVRLRTMLDD